LRIRGGCEKRSAAGENRRGGEDRVGASFSHLRCRAAAFRRLTCLWGRHASARSI
jgi:hypothetical protein